MMKEILLLNEENLWKDDLKIIKGMNEHIYITVMINCNCIWSSELKSLNQIGEFCISMQISCNNKTKNRIGH